MCLASVLVLAACQAEVDLSPERWAADYERFMEAQLVDRTEAGVATGENGAVTVAYNGLAARAGLEALKQGGNAIDAAMTTSLMQVALTAGAPISYFGIMSLVYYDAGTDRVHTMNAEWNTVLGEDDPVNIPGGIDLSSPDGMYGTAVSGRTALVGGFMKGVGAAHERFGRLPWVEILKPSIHVAEQGFPVSKKVEGYWEGRAADLARLPETKATFLKEDGSAYVEGGCAASARAGRDAAGGGRAGDRLHVRRPVGREGGGRDPGRWRPDDRPRISRPTTSSGTSRSWRSWEMAGSCTRTLRPTAAA